MKYIGLYKHYNYMNNHTKNITETIQDSEDLVQVANRLAQQYGRQEHIPVVVHETLEGIIQIRIETQGKHIDERHYRNLIDRHIPNEGRIHNAMMDMKTKCNSSGTNVYPKQKSDTKIFRPGSSPGKPPEPQSKPSKTSTKIDIVDPDEYS